MKKGETYTFPYADQGLWGSKEAELIKRRRLQMLVHSCLYYSLDENIWTDHQFDAAAKELAQLMTDYPDAYSDRFDEYFKGWDGSSGYHLPHRDPWVFSAAQNLLKSHAFITK
jgi:NAD-dependent DNA ligase